MIVGEQVRPEIRQTALFLNSKGIQVTCVAFTYYLEPCKRLREGRIPESSISRVAQGMASVGRSGFSMGVDVSWTGVVHLLRVLTWDTPYDLHDGPGIQR